LPPLERVVAEKPRPQKSTTLEGLQAALVEAGARGDSAEVLRLAGELESLKSVGRRLRVVR